MQQSKTDLSRLNEQQREAVVCESKRLLVLAGAGSGKTKTLLQKLIYLVEEKNISPSRILAITYTKNAANEMVDRLIISADNTGEYLSILKDKYKTIKEKNEKRNEFKKRFKWIENIQPRTFHSLCFSILKDFGVNEFDNQFKVIGDKKNEEIEFAKTTATETINEVLLKILIEQSETYEYLLDLNGIYWTIS